MKWLRFRFQARERIGALDGEQVRVYEGEMFASPRPTGEVLPLAQVEWLPPVRPSKIVGLWNNFHAAAAKNGWAVPAEPLYFLKSPGSLAAHRATVPVPASYDGRVAYEGELAVVIGRRTQAVSAQEAAACVFGYTCANDITALELLNRDPSFAQWTRAKSFDGFCPLGPAIETEFDFATANVRTRVAGREQQNYALADMIFPPADLVARISRDMTLERGDVILCGTSLGVLPMKPGSLVEVEIDGIGTLANTYGAAPASSA